MSLPLTSSSGPATRLFVALTVALAATLAPSRTVFAAAGGEQPAQDDCHVGAYRVPGGTLDIAPSEGGLRWRHVDGRSGKLVRQPDGRWRSLLGWTDRADGHRVELGACASGRIAFDGAPGRRIPLQVVDTVFEGRGGLKLAGRLLMPEGDAAVPVVVLVHGAEHDSARTWDFMQRQLPAEGVGAFVYDKRGTGASQGDYTQDYDVLADDAVAAVREARRLAGVRAGRVGFRGGSQGGWVAPLAATRTPVDFVVVAYGLAVSPLEEDREATILQLQLKGYGADIVETALEITDAAAVVVASDGERGIPAFDAVRLRYRDRPWYKDVYGNFTHAILPYMGDDLRRAMQDYKWGTPWHYDPMPVLRRLRTPQLWQLAEDDIDAPMAETWRRLRAVVRDDDAPITVAVFPDAEHGMTLFERDAAGKRISLRYPAGYTRMTVDFAKGTLGDGYGDARLYRPAGARPQGKAER